MAIISEKCFSDGGYIRLHDDFLPKTEEERRAATRRVEMTIASLVRQGKIILDGIDVGAEVECRIVKKED